MAQTPPFRSRPQLRPELAKLTGSPGYISQYNQTSSSLSTPQNATACSPFRSLRLQPASYEESVQPVQLGPRWTQKNQYTRYPWVQLRRLASSKPLWLILMIGALLLWWFNGWRDDLDIVKLGATSFGHDFFREGRIRNLQFFPASNPKIHYVGRWTDAPNRLRKDGSFPGVYFDIKVKNTTTVLLSLHNAVRKTEPLNVNVFSSNALGALPTPIMLHVPLRPKFSKMPSPPVSLLARIDQEEYALLPNASALVLIRENSLNRDEEHRIRIIAPMIDDHGQGVVELEGLWLSAGGKLSRVDGSLLSRKSENEDSLSAENGEVGEKHRAGLHDILDNKDGKQVSNENIQQPTNGTQIRRKTLEIITDSPNSFSEKHRSGRTDTGDDLLAGLMGWEYLVGELFGADHITIGVDGMCLTRECIGGVGQPAGLGDAFFRSGPASSAYFDNSWMFKAYVPDVLIINVGTSDAASFQHHASEYNQSVKDLSQRFENTYVSLIKAIRSQAYPQNPSNVDDYEFGQSTYVSITPSIFMPIFVMRPYHGQLEHSTHNIVTRLRADGDKAVFWLDTSGWLDEKSSSQGDFFQDQTVMHSRWRLTEQGNQKVAVFLHSHLCRYLANEEEKCPFLRHEVYQGKVFDPQQASFTQHLEKEKERKLKQLFWKNESSRGIDANSTEV